MRTLSLLLFMFFCTPAAAMESVTVMADGAMAVPVTEIARGYARNTGTIITTSYLPQQAQQAQITDGAAADILITPLMQWIDELKLQGLVDVYSLTPVAKNRLALVGPADSTLKVYWNDKFPVTQVVADLQGKPGFVVGNPATLPEGSYAREALHSLHVANDLEPYTLYIKHLDEMFDMVTKHHAYGIFLNSSAIGRQDVRIIDLVPENLHRPIQYYAVVIAGDNMSEARKFLEYLKSDTAQKIFRDSGF